MKRVAAAAAGLLALGVLLAPAVRVLSYSAVRAEFQPSDLVVRARGGEPLQEVRVSKDARRFQWAKLEEVPPHVKEAVVFAEDRRFWAHGGVDLRALARAAAAGGGGSTVTMQLAGLLDPALRAVSQRGRSYRQKFGQIRAARAIERSWDKPQILEAYLNLVPFRGEVEGITAAARLFFEKEVGALSPDEGLVLAALLRAPNASADVLADRACRLRGEITAVDAGFPPAESCAGVTARAGEAAAHGSSAARLARFDLAPHVGRILAERSGQTGEIQTTIDLGLQRFAIEQLRAQLNTLRDANVADGAALVVNNATGEVLAYVGNGGVDSSARFVDGVQAKRQAGSTLKPFLYALAIERRYLTAASILNDAPLDVPVSSGVYRPKNYDNTFSGPVSVRTALGSSLNIPAVLTIGRVGVAPFVGLLGRLGITKLDRAETYGPAAALGAPAVSLWELVNAYRALARGGRMSPLVLTADTPAAQSFAAIDSRAAAIIADILADRASRSATFGLENTLATPYWTAVKTGTSKDMTDNWCVGFSRDYTIGVWVGNFSGEPMHNVSGVTGAAPLWARLFDYLAKAPGFAVAAPPLPEGVVVRGEGASRELFLAGTESPGTAAPLAGGVKPAVIVSPPNGALYAIDPDMPSEVQRITFEAGGDIGGSAWFLNGQPLGTVNGPYLWAPQAGRHTLTVQRPDGRVAAAASFIVRGRDAAVLR